MNSKPCNCRRCLYQAICGGCNHSCQFPSCQEGSCEKCFHPCSSVIPSFPFLDFSEESLLIPSLSSKPFPPLLHCFTHTNIKGAGTSLKVIAVPISRVLHPNGKLKFSSSIQKAVAFPEDTRVILHGLVNDLWLDKFFAYGLSKEAFARLRERGVHEIITPDFPIYRNEPRFTHLLNRYRTLLFARYAYEAGFEVAFSFGAYNTTDLYWWLNYLYLGGHQRLVANLQLVQERFHPLWEIVKKRSVKLRKYKGLQIWVFGIGPDRVGTMKELLGDALGGVISSRVLMASVKGQMFSDDDKKLRTANLLSKEDLYQVNLSAMESVIQKVILA